MQDGDLGGPFNGIKMFEEGVKHEGGGVGGGQGDRVEAVTLEWLKYKHTLTQELTRKWTLKYIYNQRYRRAGVKPPP